MLDRVLIMHLRLTKLSKERRVCLYTEKRLFIYIYYIILKITKHTYTYIHTYIKKSVQDGVADFNYFFL